MVALNANVRTQGAIYSSLGQYLYPAIYLAS